MKSIKRLLVEIGGFLHRSPNCIKHRITKTKGGWGGAKHAKIIINMDSPLICVEKVQRAKPWGSSSPAARAHAPGGAVRSPSRSPGAPNTRGRAAAGLRELSELSGRAHPNGHNGRAPPSGRRAPAEQAAAAARTQRHAGGGAHVAGRGAPPRC